MPFITVSFLFDEKFCISLIKSSALKVAERVGTKEKRWNLFYIEFLMIVHILHGARVGSSRCMLTHATFHCLSALYYSKGFFTEILAPPGSVITQEQRPRRRKKRKSKREFHGEGEKKAAGAQLSISMLTEFCWRTRFFLESISRIPDSEKCAF